MPRTPGWFYYGKHSTEILDLYLSLFADSCHFLFMRILHWILTWITLTGYHTRRSSDGPEKAPPACSDGLANLCFLQVYVHWPGHPCSTDAKFLWVCSSLRWASGAYDGAVKWGQRLSISRSVLVAAGDETLQAYWSLHVVSCQTFTCAHELAIHHWQLFHCPGLFASGHVMRSVLVFLWSKIIWAHLRGQLWDWSHRKFWKKLDIASRFWEPLFLLARAPAKCKRKGRWGQMRRGIHDWQTPKVWRVHSSFGRGVRTYDGTEMGNDRQTEPKPKRCGPTRVRVLMH